MKTHTIAEDIVKQLADYGIKQIFGITGDAMNALTDALRRDGRIDWMTVRHEETAGFAISAQAELSQSLAVGVGTIGPGALHFINGIYNAARDRSPVLVITGQVPGQEQASGYFQEVDQIKAFDDVCVFSQTLSSADQMPRLLQQAVKAAVCQRGVAHIAIPTDLATSQIPVTKRTIQTFEPSTTAMMPLSSDIKQAADLLNNAQRPALLIGAGARGYGELVSQLAEKLNAPVVHSLKGTEVLPYDHPNSIGGIGHVGTPHGMAVVDDCDALIMLGTDFPYSAFLPDHDHIIQVDLNAEKLGHRCAVQVGIAADVGNAIKQLLPHLDQSNNDTGFLTKLQEKRDKWVDQTTQKYAIESQQDNTPIHPQSVVLTLSELASDDAIFIAEVGEVTVWAARYLKMKSNQRLIGSFTHGSLGVGLPAAIGAQAKYPSRQVIAMCGDGAFSMLLGDLVTAARYGLNLVAVVFKNDKFGFVELEMEAAGLPRFATDLVNPDYAQIANASHCLGLKVEKASDLKPTLAQALAADQPVVVEVTVNPDELIIPSEIDFKTAWKFTTGKIKEMVLERQIQNLFKQL